MKTSAALSPLALALSSFPTLALPLPQHFCVLEEAELVADDGQQFDNLGSSCSIDAGLAVLGAPYHDGTADGSGAAYVFVDSGAGWIQEAKLLASDGASQDHFGISAALRGDTIVVGAPDKQSGAAYVFVRRAGGWIEQAKLTSSDSYSAQSFGTAVALGDDLAAVGGPVPNGGHRGAVHVYSRQGGVWSLEAMIIDPTPPGGFSHGFGDSVAISGDTLVVGAPKANLTASRSGAVLVYRRVGATWVEEALLPGAAYKHYLGASVAIEGDCLIAGAPRTPYSLDGYVAVFHRSAGAWTQQATLAPDGAGAPDQFGSAVALSGGAIVVGAARDSVSGTFSGSAYSFLEVGSRWIQTAKVLPASGGNSGGFFGRSVSLSGERALIGHPYAYPPAHTPGAGNVIRVPQASGELYCTCSSGPCGNSRPESGCANSTGQGAALVAWGATDPDRVTLHSQQVVPGAFALFFQANGPVEWVFGDGLRCASGGLRALERIPRRADGLGEVSYGACPGDTPVSIRGGVLPGSGVTKYYQLWYRDANGPCGSSFNLSNGYAITW